MSTDRDSRAIDVRRLRPVAIVMSLIAVAILGANTLALLVFGAQPRLLAAAEVLDPFEYRRVAQQLSAATADWAAGKQPGPRKLAVVLGLSTAREDIDSRVLGAKLCNAEGMTVLNLGSSGGSYRELEFYLRPLRVTPLRSDLTILAVHPVWLAGRNRVFSTQRSNAGEVATGDPGAETDGPRPNRAQRYQWILNNRRGIHAGIVDGALRAREAVQNAFQFSAPPMLLGDTASPWAPRHVYVSDHGDAQVLAEQLAAWRTYGWFDLHRFAEQDIEVESLRQLLDHVRVLGGPVVIALMPEQSKARQLIPAAAEREFRSAISGYGSQTVLDFRAAVPDSLFYDYAHLNAGGRARLSLVLGDALRNVARCR